MKKYYPLTNGKELEVKVWYGRDMRIRGYYLTVTPVEIKNGMIGFDLLSTTSKLVLQVSRKSAKAEREAIEAAALIEAETIAYVVERDNLKFKEGVDQH